MAKIYTMIDKIEWKLLREQKRSLLYLSDRTDKTISKKEKSHLEGVISLIDAIQDFAVDECHVPSKTVFGKDYK